MKPLRKYRVDVAIIGAGPDGLSTALHLLQFDPDWSERVILLEKEKHPRHKPCGVGITCFRLKHLQSLSLPLDMVYVPVRSVNFRYKDRSVVIQGDPLFGEGIAVSLAYSAVTAKSLKWAFDRHDFGFKNFRGSVIISPVGQYLLLRWFLANIISPIQRSDLLICKVWSIGSLLARFFHPYFPMPQAYPFQFAPIEQMSETIGDE